jgi:L-lactate dehydrogenase
MPKGKIAVVGVGAVGATTAFTLAMSGLATELVLVDVNQPKAIGEALDIAHAAAFIKPARIYAGTFEDCRDASIIVFSAAALLVNSTSTLSISAAFASKVSRG